MNGGGMSVRVRVLYFAELRERRGRSEETVVTEASTPAGLYRELAERHGFRPASAAAAAPEGMSVAVNDEMARWESELADGDTIVFLTPFGGG
jgi:molybdopterin converting factor small subunit